MTPPLVSVVVVNWNTRELLRGGLASLGTHLANLAHETIVVDNASSDGSAEMVQQDFPAVRLIRNTENLGFGRGNNVGMETAQGEFFLLLNSDARLVDASISVLLERMTTLPRVGVAGPKILLEDGRLQASARRFPSLGRLLLSELGLYRLLSPKRRAEMLLGPFWDHDAERTVDWVVGACMLVRRSVFEATGGFDPSIFLYGEEVEWCRRIRDRGWDVLFSPAGRVLHLDHRSADLLMGTQGRIDRGLAADDRLLGQWSGAWAARLAPVVRVAGALLRLLVFSLRRLRGDDEYGRGARQGARAVLSHYARRLAGRIPQEPA